MSDHMTYQPYKLRKLGVTDSGVGRWHVEPLDGPVDEAEQMTLHDELLAEYRRTMPGVNINTVRMALAQGYPIIPAYRDGNQLRIWCEHDQKWHFHGAGGSSEFGSGNGHRVADCVCSDSPLKAHGYAIHEVGPVTAAHLAVREWPGYGCPTCDRPGR